MADRKIAEIPLGESTRLIFAVFEWRDQTLASIRKFVVTQQYEGPTKSGIALNRKLLLDLVRALSELEKSFPPQEEQEFKRIAKSETEYIRIATLPAADEGLPTVDVRKFVDAPGYQGPTKSGIRFRWSLLPDVIACLHEQSTVIHEADRNRPSLFGNSAFVEPEEPTGRPEHPSATGLADLLAEEIQDFPQAFIDNGTGEGTRMRLPELPLSMEQNNAGEYHIKTSDGVLRKVRNPVEANFIIYAQMRGHSEIAIPNVMIRIFRAVKTYENYARRVRAKLLAKLLKKVGQRSVAEYEARKRMSEAGLPWLT